MVRLSAVRPFCAQAQLEVLALSLSLTHRIFLCICDKEYQRMLAFKFLGDIVEFVKSQ
jgi:hypothetical protein